MLGAGPCKTVTGAEDRFERLIFKPYSGSRLLRALLVTRNLNKLVTATATVTVTVARARAQVPEG